MQGFTCATCDISLSLYQTKTFKETKRKKQLEEQYVSHHLTKVVLSFRFLALCYIQVPEQFNCSIFNKLWK